MYQTEKLSEPLLILTLIAGGGIYYWAAGELPGNPPPMNAN